PPRSAPCRVVSSSWRQVPAHQTPQRGLPPGCRPEVPRPDQHLIPDLDAPLLLHLPQSQQFLPWPDCLGVSPA
ncbi:MAG: hypothetical protein ACK56I_28170, partial [bacterium]